MKAKTKTSVDAAPACRAARVALVAGRLDEAGRALRDLLEREPDCLPALLLLGETLDQGREPEAALGQYERATELHPRSAAAWNARARALRLQERRAEALQAAQRARSLLAEGDNYVETAPVYLTLLLCLRDERRYKEALALAEEGLDRTPDAVLAEWATQVEKEWAEAEQERC